MSTKKSLEIYNKWKRISVVVNDLELDPQNVRLELSSTTETNIDQSSIINDLFANENAIQILESIVENGWFIDEIPIVIKSGKKYIVLEGNRRISALKVLQNPLLAPSFHSKIKPLSDAVVPIKKIDVLVAPNRATASNLLANRHTKSTTRPWRPLRQAHFYYSQLSNKVSISDLKAKYQGVDIGKFIKMCEVHKIAASYEFNDVKINNKVRQQRAFPVSIIDRLYDDKNFQEHLNFEFNKEGRIKIKSSRTRFDEEFKKVILDVVDKKIDTRTLNTEKNRSKYISSRLNKLNKSTKPTTSTKYTPKATQKKIHFNSNGAF